jgi:hypothetical protein
MSLLKSNIQYIGTDLNEVILEGITKSHFYAKANPLLKRAVKNEYTMEDFSENLTIYAYTHDPVFNETAATYAQRTGTTCQMRSTGKLRHQDFIATMREKEYATGAMREKLTQQQAWPIIQSLFIDALAKKQSRVFLYGNVDTGSGDLALCDGLFAKYVDTYSAPNEVSATSANIDVFDPSATDNVFTEMMKVIEEMPDEYAYESNQAPEKPVLFVSPYIARRYSRLQKLANTTGGSTRNVTEAGQMEIDGYEVRILTDLNKYEMYFTSEKNILLVMDDENDLSSMTVIDQYEITLKKELWFDTIWRAAIDIRKAEAMVYYH